MRGQRFITAVGVISLGIVCIVDQDLGFLDRVFMLTMVILGVRAVCRPEEIWVNKVSVSDFFLAVVLVVGLTVIRHLLL
jgi:hypothetical protein